MSVGHDDTRIDAISAGAILGQQKQSTIAYVYVALVLAFFTSGSSQ